MAYKSLLKERLAKEREPNWAEMLRKIIGETEILTHTNQFRQKVFNTLCEETVKRGHPKYVKKGP